MMHITVTASCKAWSTSCTHLLLASFATKSRSFGNGCTLEATLATVV